MWYFMTISVRYQNATQFGWKEDRSNWLILYVWLTNWPNDCLLRWFAVIGCSVTLLFFLSASWSVSGLFRLGSIILPSWWNHSNEAGHSVVWQYPCIECALAFELQYSEAIKSWLRHTHTHTQKDNQLHWSKFDYSWLVIFSCTVNNFKDR